MSPCADENGPESARLFAASRAGSVVALGQLVERHLPAIRAFVRIQMSPRLRAVEGETDLVQSVCLEILERPGRVEFRGDREFRSWLFRAVLNKLRDKLRRYRAQCRDFRRELTEANEEQLLAAYAHVVTPSRTAIAKDEVEQIEAALEQLPDRQRRVLAMVRIAGMSHAAAARALRCSEAASRQLLNRALATLSVCLERGRRRPRRRDPSGG